MSEIIIIAAVAKNNVIGKDGKIPWHIKEDFQHFKELTLKHPVIMGRKTFESLPIKPLPGRINIVITRQPGLNYEGVIVKNSIDEAIEYCKDSEKIFIIGGQSVYEQGMKFADRLEITRLNKEYEGDTFFPKFDSNEWILKKKEEHNGYSFNTYVRNVTPKF